VAGYAGVVPSLTARIGALLAAPATALLLLSCSNPAADGHAKPTDTNKPLLTGEPSGYNADDVAFANNMIAHHQQGIDISALVRNHSTNPEVLALADRNASALQSDIATARVLLVQWNENPDIKTANGGHGATLKGMVDRATIARLDSLHGSEFDTVWLQSMISRDQGAIEMADAEIANGKNVDAIVLAKEIIGVQQAEISQMKQLLGG